MTRIINKYVTAVICFYIFWLGILPLILSKTVLKLCDNFSHNTEYEIAVDKPEIKTYLIPILKFKANSLTIKNKYTRSSFSADKISMKIRILPLLSGKIHFNSIKTENLNILTEHSKELELNKNFFKNFEHTRFLFNSIIAKNFDLKFILPNSAPHILYQGKDFYYNRKNRYLSLKTDSSLTVNNSNSRIFINLLLPKNNSINKANFDIEISGLNLEPLGVFFKNFLPAEVAGLRGFINISADRDKLQTEFTDAAILLKEKDYSIIFPHKLVTNSTFNIKQDLINIKNMEIKSGDIDLIINGKIKNYLGDALPTLDLKAIINKSKTEAFVNLMPPFKVEEFDGYKLKKYKLYGNTIGNLAIKGRLPEPDITGNIFIDNGILVRPIYNAVKGASIKLSLTGRHADFDVLVPTGDIQKIHVKGTHELYNIKYVDLIVESTSRINMHALQSVINPLHEILNFTAGPLPILDVSGDGNVELNVKGTRNNPHMWGHINFYNTTANFIKIPDLKLVNADAGLSFNDKNVLFNTQKGKVNGQDFTIKGTCDLNGNFDFNAYSDNQPTKELYNGLLSSTMIDDLKKMIPKIDNISGFTDLNLKIYGSVKKLDELEFNKNFFAKGTIKIKDNNLASNGIDITNANADIKLDGNSAEADIKALIGNSPLQISAKVKNEIGDLTISIPKLNPNFLLRQEYKNKNYLPFVEISAKYKGNINSVEYDKLSFDAEIISQEKNPLLDVKSGKISLNNNKLILKNILADIVSPQNSIKADMQINEVFSKTPSANGFMKLKISDLKVINQIFGEGFLPDNIHNIIKDYEFENGALNADAKFINGKLFTDCDLTGIKFNYMPLELPIEILNGRLSVKNNNIRFNKINILADKMPILTDGEVKDIFNKKIFDIYINSKPRQDFIDKYINKNRIFPLKIRGDIIYNAVFKGVPNDFDLDAKVDMNKDSSIYYYGATVGDLENSIVINLNSKIQNNNQIKIREFLYDKLISSQNGKQTRLNMLKAKGGVNLLTDDMEFKDLYIKTSNPTDAKIFNIIFGKPNIKQGQFTSDLKMNGRLSNPKILGDFHIVETNIPFLDTTMKNIEFSFKDNTLEIFSKGEVMGNNVEAKAVLKNKLTKPYHIQKALISTKEMNLNRVAEKLKSVEVDNNQIQDTFGVFDVNSIIADSIVLKADNISLRNIHATNFEAETSLNKQRLFEMKNFVFNIAQGSLKGKYSYNLNNNSLGLKMQADNISANDITWAVFDLQNQIYGDMTGSMDITCNGETFEKCMQTLNGNTTFNVKNGKMPKLGSLEYLLRAGNLIKGGITSLSINNVVSLISPLHTGEFSEIFGKIDIEDGVTNDLEITTQGKDLSLFISGIYNFSTSVADMQVFGMMSRKLSTKLGPIGNVSVNTLFSLIPGVDLSKEGSLISKINKIPGIEISDKEHRKFVADIKGNINGDEYVKSFKWIN